MTDAVVNAALNLLEVRKLIREARELEYESQVIWDDAFSAISYGEVSRERQEVERVKTYRATGVHRQSVDKLIAALRLLGDQSTD